MIDLTLFALPFFQRALLAGVILSILMAILGPIIILRKMSFFSDAIGHSALTGIAIGLLLQINPFISALVFSLLVAIGITTLKIKSTLHFDTILGVFFAAAVAIGVILVQLTPGYQANLISFLFGDILTVTGTDILLISITTVITVLIMIFAGKKFIAIAFNNSLAKAEGISIPFYELLLLLTLAGIIALSVKLVGVILVTALLIIPAATAQNVARSLSNMIIISVFVSLTSTIIGILLSATINTASGPTIILVGTIFFILSLLLKPALK